jgi:hypothetical protein
VGILDHLGGLFDDQIKYVFTNSVADAFAIGAIIMVIAAIIGDRFMVVHISRTKEITEVEDSDLMSHRPFGAWILFPPTSWVVLLLHCELRIQIWL